MTELERAAEEWIAGHPAAPHLLRTRDWLLTLQPDAADELRIAALTHDVERMVPGGPAPLAPKREWDDPDYIRAHSERSAAIVDEWLEGQGAAPAFRLRVRDLIRAHETGGSADADLVQAADSLSFLEVSFNRPIAWVREGRCDLPRARARLDWARDRIAFADARSLAEPLYRKAVAALEASMPERG